MFSIKCHLLMCACTALFITPHLLNWEWWGPAGADNELGVETVRACACRHCHCRPDWLIRQSDCVFDCVSVSIKIVFSDTLSLLKASCLISV